MRIYFFFFCPRIANLLSLFYTGKGFFLFFRFSAVGHGFSLLIIGERGWKRMEEEERGGRRRQGEAEKNREARLALRLGRRVRGDDDGAEEGADGAGRGPQMMMVEAG